MKECDKGERYNIKEYSDDEMIKVPIEWLEDWIDHSMALLIYWIDRPDIGGVDEHIKRLAQDMKSFSEQVYLWNDWWEENSSVNDIDLDFNRREQFKRLYDSYMNREHHDDWSGEDDKLLRDITITYLELQLGIDGEPFLDEIMKVGRTLVQSKYRKLSELLDEHYDEEN